MTVRSLSVTSTAPLFLAVLAALGQSFPAGPAFEVASIKRSPPDARGATYGFAPGGGLNVRNGTLKGIIEMAYDVRDFQISGGPSWLASELYDIAAKTEPSDLRMQPRDPVERREQIRRRLQTLLAERFQLKVHRETKDLPVYTLVVGKSGAKLKDAEAASASENSRAGGIRSGCGRMIGTRAAMPALALTLSNQLGSPVWDRTRLSGRYDFQLDWTPDAGGCSQPTDDGSAGPSVSSSDGPSIFSALQGQLGLKLESTKGPVEVVIVDHAERATVN